MPKSAGKLAAIRCIHRQETFIFGLLVVMNRYSSYAAEHEPFSTTVCHVKPGDEDEVQAPGNQHDGPTASRNALAGEPCVFPAQRTNPARLAAGHLATSIRARRLGAALVPAHTSGFEQPAEPIGEAVISVLGKFPPA
jgi:hypothetical protein